MATKSRRFTLSVVCAAALAALLFESHGVAQSAAAPPADALSYAAGFLVTGDYVVGGVDLTPQANPPDANGFATGTVNISGVPSDADVVGAYLYWEEIFTPVCAELSGSTCVRWTNPADGVRFRGAAISPTARKASSFALGGNPATCWGAAGTSGAMVTMFRADVMYLLPKRLDANNQWTGRYDVNGAHSITLPEKNGNQAVQSAGATLVVVYRDSTRPLRKIVLYDGAFPQADIDGVTMSQMLRGFYESADSKAAKLTYVVGTGGNNHAERITFNGTILSDADPFPQTSPSSDRSWANPTFDDTNSAISRLMSADTNDVTFGETAVTTVQAKSSPLACRATAAVVFSTAVADRDGDGLPDGLEDAPAVGPLHDPPTAASPAGDELPNLSAMGASSLQKDVFVEFNAMRADPGTTYGAADAPLNATTASVTDSAGHNHLPAPSVLTMIGAAYAAHGIVAHFDVGNPDAYHNLGPEYACTGSDCNKYLIASQFARGGELITEAACSPNSGTVAARCQFYAFPGTVGWKIGLQLYRDAPVADDGSELSVAQIKNPDPSQPSWKAGQRRRRFDRVRRDYFHYVLVAHARGKPKSPFPCLDASSAPTGYGPSGTCAAPLRNNPDFHVPTSSSGVADQPGANALVTLGLWDNFVGTPFVRASTIFHELGHNFNLWHGGVPAVWGDAATHTATYIEPNCKPNYLSTMSYLYQVHGLFDDAGNVHIDYSGRAQNGIDETSVGADVALAPNDQAPSYIPAWYAPAASLLAQNERAAAAKRFCNGSKFDPAHPPAPMARVYGAGSALPIDWNGNGILDAVLQQNVNYDGTAAGVDIVNGGAAALQGYDDWASLRLDQIGAGRHETKYSDGNFAAVGAGDFLDFGSGDFLDFGSGDFIDVGSGDFLDFGSGDFLDFGSGDFLDFGSGDFLDFGSGDFLDFGSGSDAQDIDYESARALGRTAPYGLTACLDGVGGCWATAPAPLLHDIALQWNAPTVGHVSRYLIYRKKGDASSRNQYQQIATATTTTFIDPNAPGAGALYTYYVQAEFDDAGPQHDVSPRSNLVTIATYKR